jgi:hypothetical protein
LFVIAVWPYQFTLSFAVLVATRRFWKYLRPPQSAEARMLYVKCDGVIAAV